jgi:hypothetical protein
VWQQEFCGRAYFKERGFAGGKAVICRLVNVAVNGVLSTPQYGTGVNQYQSFDAFWQKLSQAFSRANHLGFSEYTGWP